MSSAESPDQALREFVSKGWQDHATDADAVFARFGEGLTLVSSPAGALPLASLVVHVAGEHLGRWQDGISLLDAIESRCGAAAGSPESKSLARQRATLARCAGDGAAEAHWTAAGAADGRTATASERIRILAVAAAAMLGRRRTDEARRDFELALDLASYGPDGSDPAARALAVTANNIAADLETRSPRTADETSFMLRAAEAALRFWRIAGSWLEEDRAFYRLGMSQLAAGDPHAAAGSARSLLAIVAANGADPAEEFFGRWILAKASLESGDAAGAAAARSAAGSLLLSIEDAEFRAYCAGELAKIPNADIRST